MKCKNKNQQSLVLAISFLAMTMGKAAVITAFTTSDGVGSGDLNITGDANLTSITINTATYTAFTGASIFGTSTAERVYGASTTDPGTATVAVSDLNLSTGTLNTNALYDISAAAVGDLIFAFGNGNGAVGPGSGGQTPPGANISLFASDGTTLVGTIANDVFFQDPGTNAVRAPNLASFNLVRSSGAADLNGRTVSGFAFSLTDVILESGAAIDDIALVNFNSGNADYQDVGIISIPEPSTGLLLFGGLSTLLLRRRK